MIKKLFYICLILFMASWGWAATYYISESTGSDGNSGTSHAQAWRELDQIEDESFSNGDKILLLCGDTWRRSVTGGADWGSSEEDIYVQNTTSLTIGAYYYSDEEVEIDGSSNICSLTSTSPRACPIIDGDKSTFTYATDYTQYHAAFRVLNGATSVTFQDIRFKDYYFAIRTGTTATSTDGIIQRIRAYNMGQAGISIQSDAADDWIIQDSIIQLTQVIYAGQSANWGKAIAFNYADGGIVRRNIVGQTYGEGIAFWTGANDGEAYHNIVWDTCSGGIYLSTSHNVKVYHNFVLHTNDSDFKTGCGSNRVNAGIGFGSEGDNRGQIDSSGCVFRANIVAGYKDGFINTDGQDDSDIWSDATPGTTNQVINNTFIDNTRNYRVESGADKEIEIEFQNNLSVINDTSNSSHSSVASPGTEFVWSGNGWDNSESADTDYCTSSNCSSGGDISGNPDLINPSPCAGAGWYGCAAYTTPNDGDGALDESSAFINTAADLGTGSSYLGLHPISDWVDDVSTLNQDSYGAGWEFGAYVYGAGDPTPAGTSNLNGIILQGVKIN